jgi:hypothetical protein
MYMYGHVASNPRLLFTLKAERRKRKRRYRIREFVQPTLEELIVASIYFINYGARRHWFVYDVHSFSSIDGLQYFWETLYTEQECSRFAHTFWRMVDRKFILQNDPHLLAADPKNSFRLAGSIVGNDIKNTFCGADLNADVVQSIMMFVDWPNRIKLSLLPDVFVHEIQVDFQGGHCSVRRLYSWRFLRQIRPNRHVWY